MERQIVCFKIPSFEIALATLEDTALRGRPVAVAAGTHARAVLREVSVEAARDGVCAGMAVDHARWLCPPLQLLPPSSSRIRRGQRGVQEIVARFSPLWEPAGPGHVFLDLTGTQRLFGAAVDTASRIAREIGQRHGLAGALGVGTNKLVTDVATTLVRPTELCDVRPGDERPFMAPLPPTALPELARPAARTLVGLLDDLNMTHLGAIAAVPLPLLQAVAGPVAVDLHRRAQGIDESPVVAERSGPWIAQAAILDPDSVDLDRIRAHLFMLIERLARDLRRRSQRCRRLRLTVVYSDFVEASRETDVRPETNLDAPLYDIIETLRVRAFSRRVRVRRLIVDGEVGSRAHEQLNLFPAGTGEPFDSPANGGLARGPRRAGDDEKMRRLADAVDRIRGRYGESAVRWGRVVRAS